jgi:hypothetical protein
MTDPKQQVIDSKFPSIVVGEKEYEIEDKGPEREKPAMVIEDERGWREIGRSD